MERDKVQRGYYFSSVPFDSGAKFIANVNGIEPVFYEPKYKQKLLFLKNVLICLRSFKIY